MKYNPALDGLRALAVFSVVIYHAKRALLPGGWAGVDIFFVLSDFLITNILSSELNNTGHIHFIRFYLHRILRLTPALACLFLFEITRAVLTNDMTLRWKIVQATTVSAAYFMNWSRAFALFPQDVLGHTWSLSMEEQFYIFWPITLGFICSRRPAIWITIAILSVTIWRLILAFSGADPERTYNGFDTHSDALLIGCLLSIVSMSPRVASAARRLVIIPVFIMALIFAFLQHRTMPTQTVGLSVSAFCSAWIILSILQDNWLARFLSLRPIVYTGRISYGWYLWHFPIITLGRTYLPESVVVRNAGLVGLIAFSYGVAALSFEFIEKPFLRLKSRVDAKT